MALSARNQLRGTVTDLVLGAVMAEVSVDIGGGNVVVAAIPRASAESLGIEVGKEVVAVVKATEHQSWQESLKKNEWTPFLLTGEPFSAQRALELGFANRVVPLDKLMETAIDLANRIAVNAPLSVQASKRIAMGISEGAIASDASFWEANNREGRVVMQSQDAKEGPLAFAQKRQPVWQAK